MTKPTRPPTIAMAPMPEYGYDPIPLILSGEKVRTLRKSPRCGSSAEVTVNGGRTGIILYFNRTKKMINAEFMTNEFAYADGFRMVVDEKAWYLHYELLEELLEHFYGEVPEAMWCSYFRVVEVPDDQAGAKIANKEEE